MRTTVTLSDDVSAELERLRREQGLGLSEALNTLARRGMTVSKARSPYRHRTVALGLKQDVTNVAEVLEILDESP